MAAYVVGIIEVLDAEAYEDYRKLVPDSLAPYGGRFIARGGQHQVLEGALTPTRVVIIEFDTYEQAQSWYNSDNYQVAKLKRLAASTGNLLVVEGV